MKDSLLIHTDGGARGNPGPGACAFVIHQGKQLLHCEGFFLGAVTNNVAEYAGVVKAYEWLFSQHFDTFPSINFMLDSELVVRQLQGLYKVSNEELKKYFAIIKAFEQKLINQGRNVTYAHVKREFNKDADALVNKTLDENYRYFHVGV